MIFSVLKQYIIVAVQNDFLSKLVLYFNGDVAELVACLQGSRFKSRHKLSNKVSVEVGLWDH
jgi:uncharacterized protein YqiB (DUF1249 family)